MAKHGVTIRIASFSHSRGDAGMRVAYQGETVTIGTDDYERGLAIDAFVIDPDPVADEADGDTESDMFDGLDLADIDVATLAGWIAANKPTVSQIVAFVGNDEEVAETFIEAENIATGQSPRASLVKALEAVAYGDEDDE